MYLPARVYTKLIPLRLRVDIVVVRLASEDIHMSFRSPSSHFQSTDHDLTKAPPEFGVNAINGDILRQLTWSFARVIPDPNMKGRPG